MKAEVTNDPSPLDAIREQTSKIEDWLDTLSEPVKPYVIRKGRIGYWWCLKSAEKRTRANLEVLLSTDIYQLLAVFSSSLPSSKML